MLTKEESSCGLVNQAQEPKSTLKFSHPIIRFTFLPRQTDTFVLLNIRPCLDEQGQWIFPMWKIGNYQVLLLLPSIEWMVSAAAPIIPYFWLVMLLSLKVINFWCKHCANAFLARTCLSLLYGFPTSKDLLTHLWKISSSKVLTCWQSLIFI